MLFDVQGSMFVAFPILLFALPGYPRFFREHRLDALFLVGTGLLLLLIHAGLRNPLGLWSYGPRYMVVILPLLGLPFVLVLDFLLERIRKWWSVTLLGVIALVLGWSFQMQCNVNAVPFFAYFQVRDLLAEGHLAGIDHYMATRPFGVIYGDIFAARRGIMFPPLQIAFPVYTDQSIVNIGKIITEMTSSNYYWFPDQAKTQEQH